MTEPDLSDKFADLRRRAEALAQSVNPETLSLADARRLVHELQVHQIELEIQNEELRITHLALEDARQRLRNLYDFSPVCLFTLSADERILEANSVLLNLLGVESHKLLARPFSTFIDPSSQDTYHLFFQTLKASGQPQQCEIALDQQQFPAVLLRLDSLTLHLTGELTTYQIAATNITQQHRLMNTLRETEQQLRAVINSATDYAIFTLTATSLIDSWSVGAEVIFGYSTEEVLGQPVALLFTPEDRASHVPQREMQAAILKGVASDNRWLVRKNGSRFFANGSLHPLYNVASQLMGFTKVVRDMTIQQQQAEVEQQQHQLMRFLRESAMSMSQSLDLAEVLARLGTSIQQLLPTDGLNIMLLEGEQLKIVYHIGYQAEELAKYYQALVAVPLTLEAAPLQQAMLKSQLPLLIPDLQQSTEAKRSYHPYPSSSYLGLPIIINQQVIGFLNIQHLIPGFFTEVHLKPLEALLAQAVIAIKNAQLYEQVQHLAILEERQRFSRDLHDSITQMMFSSSLLAESLPNLVREQSPEVASHTELIRRLNRAAYAELRKILLELRLEENQHGIDLVQMLPQLAQAAMGHSEIDIQVQVQGDLPLPAKVQMVFYRIIQEALNNIIKHARATQVLIALVLLPDQTRLSIQDNGRGFNPSQPLDAHHIGLQNMRERAATIHAVIEIKSQPGHGTEVSLMWQPEQA